MKRSRFNDEQIIGILKEQEAGAVTADVCRRHGISEVNRPGFVGGSNFQIGWSRYEQDDEQIFS
jgi:hypothetical protein